MTGIEILAMAFLAGCAAKFARDNSGGFGESDDSDSESSGSSSGSSFNFSALSSSSKPLFPLSETKPLLSPVFDLPQPRRAVDIDIFDRSDRDYVPAKLPQLDTLSILPPARKIDIDSLCGGRDRPINVPPLSELVAPLLSSKIDVGSVSRSDTSELFGRKPFSTGGPRRSKSLTSGAAPAFTPLPKAPDPLAPWKPAIEPVSQPFVEDTPALKPMPFPPLFPKPFEPTTLPKGPDPFAPWRW